MDNFKYEWEGEITPDLMDAIDALLPDGIHLIGLAVDNADTAEGALILHPEVPAKGVLMADLFKDIKGDADAFYDVAVKSLFRVVQ